MANGQIESLLKFASMQIAAESFLTRAADSTPNQPPEEQIVDRLILGNTHASRFTSVQAAQFTDQYEVLTQYRNDPLKEDGTGFSATVFRKRGTEEYTLSFRSTEFIDDAVRDNKATNELEVKDLGWALGQISEMENWYKNTLTAPGGLLAGKKFNVTGYSLGGHLATAFNILRREEFTSNPAANPIIATYTFNGAGTGQLLNNQSLTGLISNFSRIRTDYQSSKEFQALSTTDRLSLLSAAQARVELIIAEKIRVAGLQGVANANFENRTAPVSTKDQASLDYQVAALLAGRDAVGAFAANPFPKQMKPAPASLQFPNMTEVVGMETDGLATSFVSNSGLHYGSRQEVAIEAQPTKRGTIVPDALLQGLKLLVNNPAENDFGDTHSLVLLVDSLSLMAVMETLAPSLTFESARQIFAAMSSASASSLTNTQGKAEGDTLERTLDALRKIVLGPGQASTPYSLDGNTWHLDDYRKPYQENIAALKQAIMDRGLVGKLTIDNLVGIPANELANLAQGSDALGYRYALRELNPFAVGGNNSIYISHNLNGELNSYDPATNNAGLSAAYLTDRAEMLGLLIKYNTANGNVTFKDNRIETMQFSDRTIKDASGGDLTLTVIGRQAQSIGNPAKVIFGSDQNDTLEGSDVNAGDHLYGGAGEDSLDGKGGNDYLEGGKGNDTYRYSSGEGEDTILDTDGSGQIIYSVGNIGYVLSGGKKVDPFNANSNLWVSDNKQFKYELVGDTVGKQSLLITGDNGKLTVLDFDNGELGITLEGANPPPSQPTERKLVGTTSDPEQILVSGLSTNDLIEGGPGIEIIAGGYGNDRIFSDGELGTAQFIAQGNAVGTTLRGNFLSGGPGKDTLVGTTGADVLLGGYSDDLLLAGPGNDVISGDDDQTPSGPNPFTWSFSTNNDPYSLIQNFSGFGTASAGSLFTDQLGAGKDVIYAGSGADYINGNGGDDTIFGENDNDIVLGGEGNDILFGGNGDDKITGELHGYGPAAFTLVNNVLRSYPGYVASYGNDYIDGGEGNDELTGEGGNDELFGGAGDDTINGDLGIVREALTGEIVVLPVSFYGDDYIDGGAGDDILSGQGSADTIYGGAGNDRIEGDSGDTPEAAQGNDYLYGGDGSDNIKGFGGKDSIYGDAGDDFLFGGKGGDLIFGGLNADLIRGDEGDDYLDGGDGVDQIFGGDDNDTIFGGEGSDGSALGGGLWGDAGNDVIDGEAGNDELHGGTGADQLFGGADADRLFGEADGDTLTGGAGNDLLVGGTGKDTYVFNLGDGVDTIQDDGSGPEASVLVFGPGISQDTISIGPGSQLIRIGPDGDAIEFANYDAGNPLTSTPFDVLKFDDGSTLTYGQFIARRLDLRGTDTPDTLYGTVLADKLSGLSGNDHLISFAGNDTLIGGIGADLLEGGVGDDTYLYNLGDGADRILETPEPGSTNVLQLGKGISANSTSFGRLKGDVIIRFGNEADSVLLQNWFEAREAGTAVIDLIQFSDNASLTPVQVDALVAQSLLITGTALDDILAGDDTDHIYEGLEGSDTITAGAGNDVLHGGPGNDTLYGNVGDDTLEGGPGDDRLFGGTGHDVYVFGPGDGNDTITKESITDESEAEVDNPGDTLSLGYTVSQTMVLKDGATLYFLFDSGDSLKINAGLDSIDGSAPVDRVEFLDGAVWNFQSLSENALDGTISEGGGLNIIGTSRADLIRGYEGNDTLSGGSGDDIIFGNGGNDKLTGGTGDDQLYGGTGNDRLIAGSGTDWLSGGPGSDTYAIDVHGNDGRTTSATLIVDSAEAGDINRIEFMSDPSRETYLPGWRSQLVYQDRFTKDSAGNVSHVQTVRVVLNPTFVVNDGLNRYAAEQQIVLSPAEFDPVYPAAHNPISEISFPNGDAYTYAQLFDLPFEILGSVPFQTLPLGDIQRTLTGVSSVSNTFHVGAGKTTLIGGPGQDTYYLNEVRRPAVLGGGAGPWNVTIVDAPVAAGATSAIYLADINPGDVELSRQGNDMRIHVVTLGDTAIIVNWFQDPAYEFSKFGFVDETGTFEYGTIWDNRSIKALLAGDHAPMVVNPISDQQAMANTELDIELSDSTFSDIDAGDALTYTATLADGSPLPDWLTFDAPALTFHGTATNGGFYRISVTATDRDNVPVVDIFSLSIGIAGLTVDGTLDNDVLIGSEGDDTLNGDAGDDMLIGQGGNDLLAGGSGDDIYEYNVGWGVIRILDTEGTNTVSFVNSPLITPESIKLTPNFLRVLYGDPAQPKMEIILDDFNPKDVLASNAVSQFNFADGSSVSYADLVGRGFDVEGTEFDDLLSGTNVVDRISGFAGDDVLQGGNGDDTLDGGADNDLLSGGAGNDIYVFGPGSGMDVIDETGSLATDADVISLAALPDEVSVTRDGGDLSITLLVGEGNTLTLRDFDDAKNRIARIDFLDGSSWERAALADAVTTGAPGNRAPKLVNSLANAAATEDSLFSLVVPANTFADTDAGDALRFSATRANGAALPTWLDFEPATGTFSGTPSNGDVGILSVKVRATDNGGLRTSGTFDIVIANVNDAPVLARAIVDRSASQNVPFTFVIPAGTFKDADVGGTLSYAATLTGGGALPDWISFNAAMRTFSGVPVLSSVGKVTIQVTATDTDGKSASDAFDLTVVGIDQTVSGSTGDDVLAGGIGNDTLIGSAGNDLLRGGPGNDTYLFNAGDGIDRIQDLAGSNIIRFGDGITADLLTLGLGSLLLRIGADGDAIHVDGMDPADVYAFQSLVEVDFSDGSTLSYRQLIDRGFDIFGSAAGDVLTGTNAGDRMNGLAGDDVLQTGDGSDVLDGGPGNDKLVGGAGNDTYYFGPGSGADTLDEAGALATDIDVISLGVTPGSIAVDRKGTDLRITLAGSGDTLTIRSFDDPGNRIEQVAFSNGEKWNRPQLVAASNATASMPPNGNATPNPVFSAAPVTNVASAAIQYVSDDVWGHGIHARNDGSPGHAGTGKTAAVAGKNRSFGVFSNDLVQGKVLGTVGGDAIFLDDDYSPSPAGPGPRLTGILRVDTGSGDDLVDLTSSRYACSNITLDGGEGADVLWASSGDDLLFGGSGGDDLFGGAGSDYLDGGDDDDALDGDHGNDMLEGASGNDAITDHAGNNLFWGGDGNDQLTGGDGNDMLVGGRGDDTISTGQGANIIAFNRGDGRDVVKVEGGISTLSLGGGARYEDLLLTRRDDDLVLAVDDADGQITFADWYSADANRAVNFLEVIAEAGADFDARSANPLVNRKLEAFDFRGIVERFDAAGAPSRWAVMDALLDAHLAGSDAEALGGDLVYRYGLSGSFSGLAITPIQDILTSPQFGSGIQHLQPLAGLQDGLVKLG